MTSKNQHINDKLLKPYEPKETETKIYKIWEKSGFFNPDVCIEKGITKKDAPIFSMVLPPPNVTGVLHMGHGLMLTVEDIMIRYNRMLGKRTLWLPGTDHAAIATQSKVEKDIYKKEGKNRYDIGREELLKRINTFVDESRNTIISQTKRMGASLDWSRESFTLDEKRNLAVRTAFKKMYDDGLIYRGSRIINWDPKGQTTVSDDEVNHEERKAKFYTFRYSKGFPIAISTTRPETKVGDTAVAVHPDDTRYKEFIGKTYSLTFAGVPLTIKIVADSAANMEFGTGAVGVTPAHSTTDAEIAERHNLPTIQVIDEKARMMVVGDLNGKKTTEAREMIVEWLKKENLLEKEEEIFQNVSVAERTGGIIEPLPKLQWFIAVNKKFTFKESKIKSTPSGKETTLKELMRKTIESGEIKILPEYFDKTYFNWIDNLRDWCISRQIWYGHRIPVWYRGNEIHVDMVAPKGDGWIQDEDTLDTWFSSGLWTFSTLGWPNATEDLKTYHPTSVLETGHDIIFFWVARMILMTTYLLGDIPFPLIYLNGIVRDKNGLKMSKSLGNGLDPLEIADKYGADAGRMALVIGTAPGTDSRISEEKIKGYKHFANKIWNITRFIISATGDETQVFTPKNIEKKVVTITETEKENTEIVTECDNLISDITVDMNKYNFHIASEKIYHYIWHRLADEILEQSKPVLYGDNKEAKSARVATLLQILKKSIAILHPFMPFVTEEIWSMLPGTSGLLMVEKWPTVTTK